MPVSVQWAVIDRFPVGWRMGAHHHDDIHEILLVTAGRLRTAIDGVVQVAEPGSVVLHVAGRDHAEEALGTRPFEALYANVAVRGAPRLDAAPWQIVDHGGRVEAAMRWAVEAFAAGTASAREAASGLIAAALHEFIAGAADPDAELVRRVRAYAIARLGEPLTLDDLAAAAALSRYHFARRFRVATRQSPMRWLSELRLDSGRHLLATTDLTVEAIGRRVGFPDRFHFSRAMRRRSGRPPSGWRR
ncbi:MAG TPA: AraC family transcriptional regulator [Planctomycetota bacterium]|nr:AraC family transcriptional regulator [Planctomycetota bacterium]